MEVYKSWKHGGLKEDHREISRPRKSLVQFVDEYVHCSLIPAGVCFNH